VWRAARIDASLPISVDQETTVRAWREVLTLARGKKLTVYDAAYLELAVCRGLPPMTSDQLFAGAAKRFGVSVFP
jgi:predicted nucleic acid-binding protein